MIQLHPKILRKDGKAQLAVLPYEEFIALQEALEDADDLALLEEARREAGDEPNIPFDEVSRRLGVQRDEEKGED